MCEHKWKTIREVYGDDGLIGFATNVLFGGITHYRLQRCVKCGEERKLNLKNNL